MTLITAFETRSCDVVQIIVYIFQLAYKSYNSLLAELSSYRTSPRRRQSPMTLAPVDRRQTGCCQRHLGLGLACDWLRRRSPTPPHRWRCSRSADPLRTGRPARSTTSPGLRLQVGFRVFYTHGEKKYSTKIAVPLLRMQIINQPIRADCMERLAAWHLPGGPVGPASRWGATSNIEEGL